MSNCRSSSTLRWTASSLLFLACLPVCSARLSDVFDKFFPNYGEGFQTILHQNCSSEYEAFLKSSDTGSIRRNVINGIGGWGPVGYANLVNNCILEATPEVIKAKMASAQIILGLAPTLLAAVGVRPQDSAILAMLGRKPLLATLLALASPAIPITRASDYALAITELQEPGLPQLRFKSRPIRHLVEACIYILAAASLANVVELAWEMADKIIIGVSPDSPYMPLLWVLLGSIAHALATGAMWLAIDIQPISTQTTTTTSSSDPSQQPPRQSYGIQMKNFTQYSPLDVGNVQTLGESEHHTRFRVSILPGTIQFYMLSWLTSSFTACDIVFGTVLLASSLFISIDDSLVVFGRLLVSAVVGRFLLKLEMVLLRERIEVVRKQAES